MQKLEQRVIQHGPHLHFEIRYSERTVNPQNILVDLKIFLFLILFYITGQLGEYAVILILAFVHELGHLLAGIILGMKPAKLELKPYGISISFKINPNDYNKKIAKGNL